MTERSALSLPPILQHLPVLQESLPFNMATASSSPIRATSRSSLWPPPTHAPAAYPSYSSYTPAAIASAFVVPLETWTPPASCQGQAPTLTWDVGRHSQPSVLLLNQFYRTTVTENGEPATSTVGYECFPPGYRWDEDGGFYFTPGVCPIGYYEATSQVTSSYTRTETEGYCCPSSYSAYSSGIGCYSNLVGHSAPVVGYKFLSASALVNKTTVTFYDAVTSVSAFAAATVMASFPSMTAPPQVIRPAILIRYGGTEEEDSTSSGFNIGTFKVGVLKLTTLISIIAAVIFCLILVCACACYRTRRRQRSVLVLVPDRDPTPQPIVNNNTSWAPTPQNAYPIAPPPPPPRYPAPVNAFNPRRSEMSAYVPPPVQPYRGLTNAPPVDPFAKTPGPAIPRPPPAVPKPPSAPATPAPAYTFGSTGPDHVSPDSGVGGGDDNADAPGTEGEDALAREVFAAVIADALASTESSKPKGPSKAPPKFAVPALPPSQVPAQPPTSRSPPPDNNLFVNDIPMQNLPSPARSPPHKATSSTPSSPPPASQDLAPAVTRIPAHRESLADKLDLEPMTLSSSRNTRHITGAEVRECRELVQQLIDGHSSAQRGVYRAVCRIVSSRDAWNAEDWDKVLEIIRRLRVQYGIEVSV
ncbi:hypothetical protein C7212DRAFT_361425 [Tuber magnatum]|uniref:Uncharacterized protein n=1 Tax=Tuber magnatum TaxID=42249 RepID=A0A317T039_9PEZI|nr:hypothetical protein C7212DRAFT_361425 [Tuber magnatum]